MKHLLWGLSRMKYFWHGLQEVGAIHCGYLWLQRWDWLATTMHPWTDTTCGPIHLKGTTQEGIVTEHHLLLLLHPQEHTGLAAATTKCSRKYPRAWSLSLPRILHIGAPVQHLLCGLSENSWFIQGLQVAGGKPPQLSLTPEVVTAHYH